MQNFVFENPTRVVFGAGVINKLARELKKLGYQKALIVIGRQSSKKNGFLQKVLDQLQILKVDSVLFEGILPNPEMAQIHQGADLVKASGCDFIIGLGGGSVMDSSKAIALIASQGGNIWDYTSMPFKKGLAIQAALPVIAIPTLAGTGSEADPIAVISNPLTREKKSLSGYALFPKLALIDPELTLTCHLKQSLEGAFDIFCHSAETYFSSKEPAMIQDGFTETLCKTVLESVALIQANPFDINARSQLSWASAAAMAGFLSGRNGGWPMHAIEHQVSGFYPQISHGSGLAALFIPVLEWNVRHTGLSRIKIFFRNVFQLELKTLEDVSDGLLKIFKEIGFYTNLKKLGVKKEDLSLIAQSVLHVKGNKEQKLVNIENMALGDIESILRRAYEI